MKKLLKFVLLVLSAIGAMFYVGSRGRGQKKIEMPHIEAALDAKRDEKIQELHTKLDKGVEGEHYGITY